MNIQEAKTLLALHKDSGVIFTRANFGDVNFTLAYTDDAFALSIMSPKETNYSKLIGRAEALDRLLSSGTKLRSNGKLQHKRTRAVAEAINYFNSLFPTDWPKWLLKIESWDDDGRNILHYVMEDVRKVLSPYTPPCPHCGHRTAV